MNLYELLNIVKKSSKKDKRVNSVYIGDPYEIWNQQEIVYSSVVFNYTNATENYDYVDFNFVMYVADLLSENQKNENAIHSITHSIISNIMKEIDSCDDIDIVYPFTVNFFSQNFCDVLAGVYSNFSIRVSRSLICE